jgi:hypothetical protein
MHPMHTRVTAARGADQGACLLDHASFPTESGYGHARSTRF